MIPRASQAMRRNGSLVAVSQKLLDFDPLDDFYAHAVHGCDFELGLPEALLWSGDRAPDRSRGFDLVRAQSFDCKLHALLDRKRAVSRELLAPRSRTENRAPDQPRVAGIYFAHYYDALAHGLIDAPRQTELAQALHAIDFAMPGLGK
jgi:hypothetical protein